jgi:hypothetical protein
MNSKENKAMNSGDWQERVAKEEGFKSVAEWKAWHEAARRDQERFERNARRLEDENMGGERRRDYRKINRF